MPIDKTYVVDLSTARRAEPEVIESYIVYTDGTIEFDSTRGPWYRIDFEKSEILGCTSEGAKIVDCKKNGNTLTLKLYSDELPAEVTYTFDISKNVSEPNEDGMGWGDFDGKDMVEYFNILSYENTLEFDSEYGPYYKIDLQTGEILYCTSDDLFPDQPKAKVIHCSSHGNHITLTLYSAELPYEMTYIFNIKNHKQVCGVADYDKNASHKEISNIIDKIEKGNYEGDGVDEETAEKIKKAKEENKTIVTTVETSCIDTNRVDEQTKQKVEQKAQEEGLESVQYMDISIVVYADAEMIGKITELENSVDFTLGMTDDVQSDEEEFCVVRVHEDEVDVLDAQDNGNNSMTLETDRFSTYVLARKSGSASNGEEETQKDEISTDDSKDDDLTNETENDSSEEDAVSEDESELPEDEKEGKKQPNPALIVGIVISVLAVLAAGGFAVYWVIKKKRLE